MSTSDSSLVTIVTVALRHNPLFKQPWPLRPGDGPGATTLDQRHAAARREPWVSTFTWHLPDLGTYDYTQGCVSQGDGTWEKLADDATCEAEVLTRIHWDLQQVLVENGVAAWARPEGLGGI